MLTVLFIADVIRNPALTTGGKVLWIVALILVPVFAWLGVRDLADAPVARALSVTVTVINPARRRTPSAFVSTEG